MITFGVSVNEVRLGNLNWTGKSNTSYLIEEWVRFRLANAVKVRHVNQLEIIKEARILHAVLRPLPDVGQVTKRLVTPVVQITQAEERQ